MTNIDTRQPYIPGGFRIVPNEWVSTRAIPPILLLNRAYDLRRFGAPSAFGAVYQIVDTDFIIKIMKRGNRSDVRIFDNEVGVGSTPGIGDVGPRIYAYKKTPTQMVYIMNNVITQNNLSHGHKLLTLREYYNSVLGRACPLTGHPIYKALSQTLVKFYTLTQGWHGDLHDQNILVIVDRNDNVLSTKIIDYGAHQKFTRGVPDCLRDIFARTQTEFNRKPNQQQQPYFPLVGRVKQPLLGQPYRINQNVLTRRLGRNFVTRLTNTNNTERARLAREAAERARLVREAENNYITDLQKVSQEIININQNLHRKISTEKNNLKRSGVNNEKIQKFSTNVNKLLNKQLNKYEKKLTSYTIRKALRTGKTSEINKNKIKQELELKRRVKNGYIKNLKNELRSHLPTPMNIN